jgi:hypothetical protein
VKEAAFLGPRSIAPFADPNAHPALLILRFLAELARTYLINAYAWSFINAFAFSVMLNPSLCIF